MSRSSKPRRRILVALAPLLALAVATPAFAQAGPPDAEPRGSGGGAPEAPPAPAPPGRWIVELDTPAADERGGPPPTPGQIDRAQAELAEVLPDDVPLQRRLERVPYAVVEASSAEIEDLLATGVVREATPDRLLYPSLDDSAGQIGAPDVWSTTEGAGQVVAVVDTGVRADHEHLDGRIVGQACFAEDEVFEDADGDCPNGDPEQTSGEAAVPCDLSILGPDDAPRCDHGTHVAGIVAGEDAVHRGVAPAAGIYAIQVFHETSAGAISAWTTDIALALDHLLTEDPAGLAAVNLSLGAGLFTGTCDGFDAGVTRDLVAELADAGVSVVAASGNDGNVTQISFPACVTDVISVGAVLTPKAPPVDAVAAFSNASAGLDLLAPGAPVESAIASEDADSTASKGGTSMATPHVAGAIALLRDARSADLAGLTGPDQVRWLHGMLDATGECIVDPGNNRTYRRIDVGVAATSTAAPSALFDDVPTCSWYEEAVNWLMAEDLAEGFDDNTYRGDEDITRGQVGRMLHRLFESPPPTPGHEHPFSDVPMWVEAAVNWLSDPAGPAAEEPLMSGYADMTFRPNDPISRGQVARMLYRAAGAPEGADPHGFSDVEPWIDDAVSWLTEDPDGNPGGLEPIAVGYTDGTFRDHLPITRAQVARMLQRFDAHPDT